MTGASVKRKQHRLGIELLETRALLSGSSLKLPIVVADVAPATPLMITAELAPKSDPDGNGVVLRSMVIITGQTVPGAQPGMWSPTPPAFSPPVGLNFAFVTPFAMTSPSQFRPGPPRPWIAPNIRPRSTR